MLVAGASDLLAVAVQLSPATEAQPSAPSVVVSSPTPITSEAAPVVQPSAKQVARPSPTTAPAMPQAMPTTVQVKLAAPPAQREYTVRSGDQLVALADRFGVSIDATMRANGLPNPDRIQIGQVLHIQLYTPNLAAAPASR